MGNPGAVVLPAVALVLAGCAVPVERYFESRRETRSVPLDNSEFVRVNLKMGVGELKLQGGATNLMDGEFQYREQWEPVIDYRKGAVRGELTISHRKGLHTTGDIDSQWEVKLNPGPAIDLNASLGVGEAQMDLGTLNLRGLDINVGVGELRLDLRGKPKRSYDVRIHGGVGEATVFLPNSIAVLATARGGIGDINIRGLEKRGGYWFNPAQEDNPVRVKVDVRGGIGEVTLIVE
jgi:hypothetical protein